MSSHSFEIAVAAKYGVDEALLIHHFQYWIRINFAQGKNFKENRTWTFQTRKEIQAHFPYWNVDKVKYLCERLVRIGVLQTKNFNKLSMDKTLWYSFRDEKEFGMDPETLNKVYEGQKCPSKGQKCPSNTRYDKERYPDKDIKNDKREEPLPSGKPSPSLDPDRDIVFFSLEVGIFPDGSRISTRMARSLSKYDDQGRDRVERAIKYFNEQVAKGKRPQTGYERWLQDIINKGYAEKEENRQQNHLYARFIKEMHQLSNAEFYIMDTVVKTGADSIALNLPPETFKQIINNLINQRR